MGVIPRNNFAERGTEREYLIVSCTIRYSMECEQVMFERGHGNTLPAIGRQHFMQYSILAGMAIPLC